MIKKLTKNQLDKILNLKGDSVNLIRIKAMAKAYGFNLDFVSFYLNDTGEVLICIKDDFAFIYAVSDKYVDEISEFINFFNYECLSEFKLNLNGFSEQVGNIYERQFFNDVNIDNISTSAKDCYEVVSKVFTNSINEESYAVWYTDLSYRLRHDMSKVYTIKDKASITLHCNVDGNILITQLATIKSQREKGLASSLIDYAAAKEINFNKIVLMSQNELSDAFYIKIGFKKISKYYSYEKITE